MNNAGFYKKDETQILFAPNIVEGQGYVLLIDEKDSYSYPVDGWIYADSLDAAIAYFASNNNNQIAPFDVQPENIKLAANKEDEAEFGKLIVLINLSLQQNKIAPSTPITIWDYLKQPHSVTVSRFLEIMADYGMYCYMQRN
jgi:hypothetical protein